jgi:hypothetical protein
MESEIKELLAETERHIDEARLAADLRPPAFAKVFDLLAAQRSLTRGGEGAESDPNGPSGIGRIAARLRLEPADVAEVYYEDGERLGIGIGATRLHSTDAGATKQIALLLAGGRQAGDYDEGWTPVAIIRAACRDYGRLDTNNFATTIASMTDAFTFRGKGQSREVRLTRPGWEAAARLVRELSTRRDD